MGPARDNLDIPQWAEALRQHGLVPVGIRGGSPAQELAANAAKLAVLAEGKTETTQRSAAPSATTKSVAADRPKATVVETKLIQQPVRSGQRIYAAGGDLIVLAPVSHGAEIMADGNIHVYGSLKGRALAGVKGNLSARIFCSDLQAELVAIGGSYKISENLDASLQGRPVQIYLKDEALIVDAL
jgi:septum site-determining protein MinC